MTHRFVVVDIETTGNAPDKGDRIIQISAVLIENQTIVDQFTSFVNPEIPIPIFIEELTGIHSGMVKDAPLFAEIAPHLFKMLENAIFVAHNVKFDYYFLQKELKNAGFDHFQPAKMDTVELAWFVLPTAESYKLVDLTEAFQFTHERPHQADSDALATAQLFLMFWRQLEELPSVTLEKLLKLSHHLQSDLYLLLHHILQEKKTKVEQISADLEIYRGIALKRKGMTRKTAAVIETSEYPNTNEAKEQLFKEKLPQFELREGQFEMMDAVFSSFEEKKHALIEAGTGIGKSLGYLLPSIFYAMKQKTPVIVSTHTILLQDQLLQKEIQTLHALVPFSFRTVLLKGRSHYLHLFKFEQTLYEADEQYDHVVAKMKILVWLTQTTTGDIDELHLSSGGKLFWERIKHEGWHVSKQKDPWLAYDFYMHARQEAQAADLVITNHAMLLQDLVEKNTFFPNYDYAIIDEAHHLEQAARTHFASKIAYSNSKYLLSQIGIMEKQQLFGKLQYLLDKKGISITTEARTIDEAITALELEMDDLFMIMAQIMMRHSKQKHHKCQFRVDSLFRKSKEWQPLVDCAERNIAFLKRVYTGIAERLKVVKVKELKDHEKALIAECFSFLDRIEQLSEQIYSLIISPQLTDVVWVEGDARALPNSMVIQALPVTVKEKLEKSFFAKKKSIVMTSSTLTVQHSFRYMREAIGLQSFSILTKRIASPFEYDKMVKLMIPSEVPEIRDASQDAYVESLANHLIGIAQATKGRMLVLFTSHEMLRKTYYLIKESELLHDFMLIAQGISNGSRARLTKNFQLFEKAILFGTNSFWEGIDIPGDDLSCLVMVRLPFTPPDEPMTEAKHDYLRKQGENPFTANALPEAIIRFKQGFGRLIRSSKDRGIVIVFDRRIETTSYGKAFLYSLPKLTIERGSLEEMVDSIEKWLSLSRD